MLQIPRENCNAARSVLTFIQAGGFIWRVEPDGWEKDRVFAEPQQDLIRRLSCAAASWALQELSNWDFGIKLEDESGAPLATEGFQSSVFSTRLCLAKGSEAIRDYGYPFFFVYFHYRSLATQKGPNEMPPRFLNGLSSLHFLRMGFLCQGGSPLFHPNTPKSSC